MTMVMMMCSVASSPPYTPSVSPPPLLPCYIPQLKQPSSPVPSQYMYTSAAANNPLYGTANGGGGGNGGGGNGSSGGGGGGGGPPTMTTSNHHQPPTTFYTTGPPPASTLPPPQGPPTMPPLTLPPPPPQHHHHPQPPQAQMAIPEMYVTGPATAIYAQQAAYPIPVPEIFETPPMTELSSAQSTEDSSSNSSRSGPSNQSNDASKVNGEGGAKITPTTPVVSLLRLNLQDEGEDEAEGGGSVEGESQDRDDARRHHKTFRLSAQQPHPQHKRANVNGVNSHHRYHHRPQHHRANQMHPNSSASQPLFYLAPNYIQGPNHHFPNSPHASGYYGPPPPLNGPPHASSPHIHTPSGRGQHHGGGRPPLPHDQRHIGRPRPNQRSPHPTIPEGKKYSHCIPEGLLSCRSPPLQAPTTLMYTPMGMATPGVSMGNGGGRQQHRRYANGPRRQGGRNGGGGGGDAGDGVRPVQVLPSSAQQRQRVGKCNKTVNGTRQGSIMTAGLSGSTENMPRDGSGDGPCMPITPPGTPLPASARELATPVAAVGPETVCQMQALSL